MRLHPPPPKQKPLHQEQVQTQSRCLPALTKVKSVTKPGWLSAMLVAAQAAGALVSTAAGVSRLDACRQRLRMKTFFLQIRFFGPKEFFGFRNFHLRDLPTTTAACTVWRSWSTRRLRNARHPRPHPPSPRCLR
eukprot:Rmarinus@m.16456